jgi:selenocysteine lyase/cysteine desulfurase
MVGAVPFEASASGADFVCFACDKWLLGPEQTAALWISPRTSASVVPGSSGLARTAVLGLARSVGWIEMYVGLEWAYERTARVVSVLRESLLKIPRVELDEATGSAPAVVTFRVDRWSIEDTVDELRRRAFAIVGLTSDASAIRASVGWYNTETEMATFVAAVRDLAANTPDSIPRRLPLLGQ